jgi:dihydroorotase
MTARALRVVLVTALLAPLSLAAQTYDIVLRGGRVMDPESGLDAVRDVGIREGRIAAITEGRLEGREVIDVAERVVAPGFIDLHAHGQDAFSADLQVRDGVTTALEMEGGVYPVDAWYAERASGWRINHGATVSQGGVRLEAMGGDERAAAYDEATPDQIQRMQALVEEGLSEGALGVGMGIQYTPGATREEIFGLFRTSAKWGVTNFVHVRYAGLVEPESSISAVQEMIADAAGSGGSVHIVHIGSSGLKQVPVLLDMIGSAHAAGVDVTTEVYPYTAASTDIRSAIFDPGWRERLGGDHGDIEWIATGERLDSAAFERRREEGGPIIAHVIPREEMEYALAHPLVLIASDGTPFVDGRAHPRGAGTFARVLGRYVREAGTLTLMDALRKMTLLPARRLEPALPEMRRKGRVAVGADADLTVFDPATVLDRATFAEPAQPSAGIPWVLVGGVVVVRDGRIVASARPGRAVRRRPVS